jgi:TolB-like protein
MDMQSIRSWIAVSAAALTVGCASSGQMRSGEGATGAGIAKLEKARASRPNDAGVARSLGIAYYKANRFADARPLLDQAARLDPRDGTTALFLGLTAEKQNDIAGAKNAYRSYVRYGRTSKVRKQLEARLAALTREELKVAAKSAIAQEQQLATQPGSAKTVAVMPLRFVGADTSLQPLERGLAELIIIDLARSHELTVVERARLQAILDEIALQQSGRTDSATNVRAGKIIQAGRIVNGQIVQNAANIRVDAAILNSTTSSVSGGASSENTLEQIFAIQKAIVQQLFDSLGVTLTADERKELELTPTRSLQAFLAYSRGLRLEDQGRYEDAYNNFREAVRLDPSFGMAMTKSAETQAAAVGMGLSVASMEANLAGTQEQNVATQANNGDAPPTESASSSENSPTNMAGNVNSSPSADATNSAGASSAGAGSGGGTSGSQPAKDAVAAGQGSEGAKSAKVTIVVRVPLRTP